MRAWCVALALLIALPAQAGDWLRARTPNFVIESDTSGAVLRRHAQQLEAFRTAALWVLGKDGGERTQQLPTQLMLLKQRESLSEVRPDTPRSVWGYMAQCDDGAVAFAAVPPENRSIAQDWGTFVVFHEYAHRLMFQAAQQYYPAWFVEGFADFMAGTEIEAGRVTFRQAAPWRTGMLAEGGWLDAATLLAAGPEIHTRHERAVGFFYAQAWLLTHFMLNDTALAQRFYGYFQKVGAGADPVQTFEPAVGIAVADLNRRLRQHLVTLQTTQVSGRDLLQVLQADGVTANLRNAARGANALEPLVFSYAMLAAQVALDAGQRDEAITALTPLATYPHNPQQMARLRRAIEALRQGAGRAEFDRLLDSKA